MHTALSVRNLRKSYNGNLAVDDISFDVASGEKFVFVGPNGAGKTTTIKIISTLLKKEHGDVCYGDLLLGRDDDAIRKKIGVVFQHHVLDPDFTLLENLHFRGSFYGLDSTTQKRRIDEVLDLLNMGSFAHQRYGTLSGGQKRRADLGRALILKPEILFLDEPTTGLDPQTRSILWEIIHGIQKDLGMTVFLTTHYMEETDDANSVVILDHGKIVATGSPSELKQIHAPNLVNIQSHQHKKIIDLLIKKGYQAEIRENLIQFKVASAFDALPIIDACRENIDNFEIVNGSMDDVFLAITGKALRE